MTRQRRWLLTAIGIAAALGLAARLVVGRRSGAPPGPAAERAVPVTTAPVMTKDVAVTVEGLGNVTSLATVTVRPLVDGRLDQIIFREGQAVRRGDLLAIVDPRPFLIQKQQGEAALARDTANLANAQINLARYQQLRKTDLIPQQQVDDQRSLVAQLDASARADKAQVESARLNIEYAHVTSPITGITGVRLVDRGNVVRSGDQTGIVIVTQLEPIAIVFTVAQDRLGQVQNAMRAGHPRVEAYARNGTEHLGDGELETLDNQVNTQTATIRLKALMPNPEHHLWPNQFIKAKLQVDTLVGATVVPAPAVQRGQQGAFVYVVEPERTAAVRPVTVASVEGDEAVISKGLAPGDIVVTEGQNLLRPGVKVAPRSGAQAERLP